MRLEPLSPPAPFGFAGVSYTDTIETEPWHSYQARPVSVRQWKRSLQFQCGSKVVHSIELSKTLFLKSVNKIVPTWCARFRDLSKKSPIFKFYVWTLQSTDYVAHYLELFAKKTVWLNPNWGRPLSKSWRRGKHSEKPGKGSRYLVKIEEVRIVKKFSERIFTKKRDEKQSKRSRK